MELLHPKLVAAYIFLHFSMNICNHLQSDGKIVYKNGQRNKLEHYLNNSANIPVDGGGTIYIPPEGYYKEEAILKRNRRQPRPYDPTSNDRGIFGSFGQSSGDQRSYQGYGPPPPYQRAAVEAMLGRRNPGLLTRRELTVRPPIYQREDTSGVPDHIPSLGRRDFFTGSRREYQQFGFGPFPPAYQPRQSTGANRPTARRRLPIDDQDNDDFNTYMNHFQPIARTPSDRSTDDNWGSRGGSRRRQSPVAGTSSGAGGGGRNSRSPSRRQSSSRSDSSQRSQGRGLLQGPPREEGRGLSGRMNRAMERSRPASSRGGWQGRGGGGLWG